jgi:hypothetical protein
MDAACNTCAYLIQLSIRSPMTCDSVSRMVSPAYFAISTEGMKE